MKAHQISMLKKIFCSVIFFLTLCVSSFGQYATCTPTIGSDPENNGELNPSGLPPATLGQPYSMVMSFLPPPQSSGFTLTKIQLAELRNIPAGITWETNSNNPNDYLFVGTWYCIVISGTPIGAPGLYNVDIYANAWINVLGVEVAAPNNPNNGGSISVNVLPRMQSVSGGGSICNGDTTSQSVIVSGSDTATTYWLFRNGMYTSISKPGTGGPLTFSGLHNAGVYTVMATGNHDTNPGDNDHPMAIQMNDSAVITYQPIVNLGNDFSMSINDIDTITPGNGFDLYNWNNNNHLPFQVIIGSVMGVGEHIYYVSVQDTNGCIGSDTIAVTIFDPSTISEYDYENIHVFPNPVTNELNILYKLQDANRIEELYDIYGRKVLSNTSYGINTKLNLANFPTGNYILIITNENKNVIFRKQLAVIKDQD